MTRRRGRLVTWVACLLVVAACGDGAGPAPSPGTTSAPVSGSPPSSSGAESPGSGLLVWADPPVVPVLEQLGQAAGVDLTVLEVAPDLAPSQLSTPPTPGQTPDIVALAHDSLGPLVEQGLLAPIDLAAGTGGFVPVSTGAFSIGGQLYGLPYAVENVALIRSTDLVPDPPATFEELERVALRLEGEGRVDFPLGLPVPDPYHEYPLFAAFGGYVFGANPDGTYDPEDLGIDGPGSLRSADAFGRWRADGLIDPQVTIDVMIDAFGSGKAPFAVTGPWVVSDPSRGFETAGVPFAVEPIPPVRGATPRPLVRVLGFGVPAASGNQERAAAFLDMLATSEAQGQLAVASDRPPALTAALDDPSIGPELRGFGLSAQNGDPLPAIPEMTQVWGPWADAYAKIFQQSASPEQAFRDAATAIRAAIQSGPSPTPTGDA